MSPLFRRFQIRKSVEKKSPGIRVRGGGDRQERDRPSGRKQDSFREILIAALGSDVSPESFGSRTGKKDPGRSYYNAWAAGKKRRRGGGAIGGIEPVGRVRPVGRIRGNRE